MWTILFVIWFGSYSSSNPKGISVTTVGQYKDLKTCQAIAKQIVSEQFQAPKLADRSARCVQIKD